MAIDEALLAVARDWDRVAPLLSTDQLRRLDSLLEKAAHRLWPDGPEGLDDVFGVLAAELVDDDPIWAELQRGPRRYAAAKPVGAPAQSFLRVLVGRELADPRLEDDARAEAVDAAVRESIADRLGPGLPMDRPGEGALVLPGGRAPAFQFLPDGSVHPDAAAANGALGADEDPWGAASWWITAHARLGATPVDLLGTGRSAEIAGAAALAADDGF